MRGRESEGQRGTEREREYVASIYVYVYNHIQIDRSVHVCKHTYLVLRDSLERWVQHACASVFYNELFAPAYDYVRQNHSIIK